MFDIHTDESPKVLCEINVRYPETMRYRLDPDFHRDGLFYEC